MKRKICIITSNRAEFGQFKELIKKLQSNSKLKLLLVVTGSHLEQKFGNTITEIIGEKLKIAKKIKLNLSTNIKNRELKVNNFLYKKISNFFISSKPNLVIILGDRYELLSIAQIFFFLKIPLAHLHGGEITKGVIDDTIRHTLTKLSDIHFVANNKFKKILLKLGENPKNIYNVGSLTAENIKNQKLNSISTLQKLYKFKFKKKNVLISLHPTQDINENRKILYALEKLIKKLKDTQFIISSPNFDDNSQIFYNFINQCKKKYHNFFFCKSFGYQNYLSIMKNTDFVLGNSSSGITEAPILKTFTINIGTRQEGRPMSPSIINIKPDYKDLFKAVKFIYKKKKFFKSFYYKKNTVKNIIKVIETKNLINLKNKSYIEN